MFVLEPTQTKNLLFSNIFVGLFVIHALIFFYGSRSHSWHLDFFLTTLFAVSELTFLSAEENAKISWARMLQKVEKCVCFLYEVFILEFNFFRPISGRYNHLKFCFVLKKKTEVLYYVVYRVGTGAIFQKSHLTRSLLKFVRTWTNTKKEFAFFEYCRCFFL